MLTITVATGEELFNGATQEFTNSEFIVLQLEHSLAALSKWESRFEKPFLSTEKKTDEEIFAYVECMIVAPYFPPDIVSKLTQEHFAEINVYIEAKMTATWFSENPNAPRNRETITAELIYYWMFSAGIPLECENWHLQRLFTLLKVFSAKNEQQQPKKKMSKAEMASAAAQRRELNAKRRAQLGSSG